MKTSRRPTQKNIQDSVEIIKNALAEYTNDHPRADVQVKRQNPVAVRIRIIDQDFANIDIVEREKAIWKILEKLPSKVRADITFLLLITPREKRESLASFEFDHPIPSRL